MVLLTEITVGKKRILLWIENLLIHLSVNFILLYFPFLLRVMWQIKVMHCLCGSVLNQLTKLLTDLNEN
jgi:hypothetical protein